MNDYAKTLRDRVGDAKVVTFDVFDTCLHRAVARPVHVFDLVYLHWLSEQPEAALLIPEFKAERIAAERRARVAEIVREDISLADIYRHLGSNNSIGDHALKRLAALELQAEREVCYPNPIIKKFYDDCVSAGKTIAFISDIYLPASHVEQMLRKCGFDPVHLFISSSVGLSKETGRLFTHALDALGISDPKSVLHIGDNENADVAAPHKLGINTLHFRHLHEVDLELTSITGYKPQDECDFISALIFGLSRRRIIGRGAASTTHNLIDVGYYSFGPVFAGWLLWLTRRVSELSPDRILLFARDTQLIDRLVDEGLVSFGDAAVTYVYVSRFSLCFAGIRTLDDFSLEILLGRFKEYNFGKFLDLWMEHAPEEKSSLIIPKKLNSNTPINDFWHWTLRDFIRANSLTLLAASVKHRQHVMRHLGRDLTDGRTVLIDIGWHGNMQAAWLNAVGGKIDIKNVEGLYFGLFPDAQKNMKLGHHMEGWLTSPQEISAWTRALWSGGVELLELALSAEHGTTLGYTKEEATPILAAPNNDGDYITACRTLQMGMVEFWKDLTEFLANGEASHISTQPSEWSAPFYRLICRPMLHEVELLGDIRHRFSGGMVAKATPLAPRSPWHKRIIPRLRQSEEKAAFWKAGYVKRNRRF